MVAITAKTATPASTAPAPRAPGGVVLPATPATPAATVPATPVASTGPYIALLVAGNPKKPGTKSYARWAACHVHGQTVAAYKAKVIAAGYPAGHAAADIAWEKKHGYVSTHATAALCPPMPVAPQAPATVPATVPAAG